MDPIDLIILVVYFIAMLGVGFYFLRRNKNADDYYVGGRNMNSWHIGLSVVATDVGGGFSIALGGVGFIMGLSGSWMLLSGLIGAWLSAVLLIPKISRMSKLKNLLTFPQIFQHLYDYRVALVAGFISAIGYLGFTSSQILAGAKLANATFDGIDEQSALIGMGLIAVVYTVMGGLKAVIYTDTIQWIILLAGLIFIGIPVSYNAIGGYDVIVDSLPANFLSLTSISWVTFLNWMITFIPIWFVGMTLYQRIYACKDEKTAKRAWLIAGLFEWPIMAFLGVILGLFARVAVENGMFDVTDNEYGLPLLLKNVMPVGFLGLIMAAYLSAIMSTADSCLMASSGNIVTDIISKISGKSWDYKTELRISQITTLAVGLFAILLATTMKEVLDLMVYSYQFMVAGLFVPVLGGLYWKGASSTGALASMILGGGTTLTLIAMEEEGVIHMPGGISHIIYGIGISLVSYLIFSKLFPNKTKLNNDENVEKTSHAV